MRKIPLRQCVGCQEQKPKRSMLRIVLAANGEISLDLTGKKSGRGAYVCNDRACLELAKRRKALDRGLKTHVADDIYDELVRQIDGNDRQG